MSANRIARMLAVFTALVAAGCSRAGRNVRANRGSATNPPAHTNPMFVALPLDSIVRTLGPDVGRGVVFASPAITSNSYDDGGGGHFEWDYSLEFAAPALDADVVHAIATRLKDLAPRRGVRVTGYTLSGDASIESFSFATPSGIGWVSVVGLKRRLPNLDHFLVSVREDERPSR